MKQIIKTSSYTENLPNNQCRLKVAIKVDNWDKNDNIKTEVYENAIYDSGFVSIDGGNKFYIGGNFIFHKLKRI